MLIRKCNPDEAEALDYTHQLKLITILTLDDLEDDDLIKRAYNFINGLEQEAAERRRVANAKNKK